MSRDPKADKLRDYRNAGHCRRAHCGLCHPAKRWHRKARRQAQRSELRSIGT